MRCLKIGDVIRARREELNLTQEELCNGIIEVSTLSRIENNKHFPSSKVFFAIVERLGLPMERFAVLFTQEDFEVQEICNDIIERNLAHKFDQALELIKELEQSPHANERVLKQFILRCKAFAAKDRLSPNEFVDKMLEAVKVTIPCFEESSIENYLLSNEEMKCITNIANAYAQIGERRRAISIYQKLLAVAKRTYTSSDEIAKVIPPISYNLSKGLLLENRHEEALEVCENARIICVRKGKTRLLPNLLMNKGYALCKLNRVQEGAEYFKQAYYLFVAVEDFSTAENLIQGIKEDFDISF